MLLLFPPQFAKGEDMDQENRFWVILWSILAAAVLSLIVALTAISTYEEVKMAELGYQKTGQIGTRSAYYQKVK